jgi:hypothetical protein
VTPPSYFLIENFESASNPPGWGTAIGSPNYQYTGVILQGAQSLFVSSSTAQATWAYLNYSSSLGVSCSECWTYFLFQFQILPNSQRQFFRLRDKDGNNDCSNIRMETNGRLTTDQLGSNQVTTVGTLSPNTKYHIWTYYKKGAGTPANGTSSVAFSTDGVRPTSGNNFVQTTSGVATLNADVIYFFHPDGVSFSNVIDRVLMVTGSTAIPDNP